MAGKRSHAAPARLSQQEIIESRMSHRLKVLLGFTIICILWGSSWAAVKIGIESFPPLLSLGIRFTLSGIILGSVVFIKHLSIPMEKRFWTLVLIMSSTSFTVPFVLIYWGQLGVGSGLASVLFATYPFWVAIVSHFLLPNEKITPVRIIGVVIGFLGVIFIFNNGFSNISIGMIYCMAAIIAGSIIQAFGLVFLRRLGDTMHPVTLNFCSMSLSAIPLFAASLLWEEYSHLFFNTESLGSILYLSIFCTVITFVIYFWLVKHIEAVLLSLSAFITPVIAVVIGILLLGEKITGTVYLGSFLVLLGVAFATTSDLIGFYRRKAQNEIH
jgi:drug/metabolite transporter (DMT)-like permease